MKDLLQARHIGISEQDEALMLQVIGVNHLDELISQTIPSNIRLDVSIDLPEALTERLYAEHIAEIASKNKLFTSYIGQGWYDTCTPAVIQRNVFENPSWYTSYTPYQAENHRRDQSHQPGGEARFKRADFIGGTNEDGIDRGNAAPHFIRGEQLHGGSPDDHADVIEHTAQHKDSH